MSIRSVSTVYRQVDRAHFTLTTVLSVALWCRWQVDNIQAHGRGCFEHSSGVEGHSNHPAVCYANTQVARRAALQASTAHRGTVSSLESGIYKLGCFVCAFHSSCVFGKAYSAFFHRPLEASSYRVLACENLHVWATVLSACLPACLPDCVSFAECVILQVAQQASSLLPRTPAATNPATARHLAAAYGDQVRRLRPGEKVAA